MNQEIITFYGKVEYPRVGTADTYKGVPQFEINTRYINQTNRDVRVKLRSGLELMVKATSRNSYNANSASVVIQQELIITADRLPWAKQYFDSMPPAVESGILNLLRKCFYDQYELMENGPKRSIKCLLEFTIGETDLVNPDGVFYHDELDMLFKFGKEPFQIAHPYNQVGKTEAAEREVQKLADEHGLIFWIEIIDNLSKYGDRFISVCNQVYKIVARPDKNRPDGLYIVSSKPTNGRFSSTNVFTQQYGFDNLEKDLGIYTTYELAQSHGDVAATRKRELLDKEHELSLQRQMFTIEKTKLEAELLERNSEIKRHEHERTLLQASMDDMRKRQEHLLEMERNYLKEKFERRSTERKDASEMIKFLPTILAAVGTILMAYTTFRKTGQGSS